jgi:hypothetical protein
VGAQEVAEVIAGLNVAGKVPAGEYPAAGGAAHRGHGAGDPQPGSLAQAEHGNVVFV